MKRILSALAAIVCAGALAYAANVIPTPIVGPTETGENGLGAQQVTDMARFKLGFGTVTGASPQTLNFAAGVVTTNSLATAASTSTTYTLNNTKVQAGDAVQCTIDPLTSTGTPVCSGAHVTAGSIVFTIANVATATALNAPINIMFMVVTQGNPN